MSLGLYGGTFDPIHLGHLVLAESLRDLCGLETVAFVPAARPPHKQGRRITPFSDRCRMISDAIASNPHFELFPLEAEREGPSYTLDTVRALRADGHRAITLMIGADTVPELASWRGIGELLELVEIAIAARPGYDPQALSVLEGKLSSAQLERLRDACYETPFIEASSREIRQRISVEASVRYLVPDPVREYILLTGLYH